MGSWTELDANYPPGSLTPATALVVALAHLAGTRQIIVNGTRATFLPLGLAYDTDLLERVRRYLNEVALEDFLAEAQRLLSARQRLGIALQLHAQQLAAGNPLEHHPRLNQLCTGLGVSEPELAPHRVTLALTHDLGCFAQ
ncbi:MAG: hypothetical protein AB4911_25065 [Oscillochloridaceae bacterium umkhey_bin13]